MATIGNNYVGLVDLAKRQDSTGKIATIIEMMSQKNSILKDAVHVECNNGSNHETSMRSGLPSATWRKMYQGVQPSKSTTTQVSDATGMLEAWSQIDSKLVDLAGDGRAEFLLSESKPFIQAMGNQMASTLFYGNEGTNPAAFTGLAPRFNDLSAENKDQIINAGGSGSNNTSIWFATWGEDTMHMIYPKGSIAGLKQGDTEKETVEDGNGGKYKAYVTPYSWDCGLSVRDWRNVSRIANIDVLALTKDASAGADIIDMMVDSYYSLENVYGEDGMVGEAPGQTVCYVNRTIAQFLHKQAMNKTNANLTTEMVNGKPVTYFLGVPVRVQDAILNTEAQVA